MLFWADFNTVYPNAYGYWLIARNVLWFLANGYNDPSWNQRLHNYTVVLPANPHMSAPFILMPDICEIIISAIEVLRKLKSA